MPGRFGIGELGQGAYRFVDFLAQAGQSLWQILPLGPTGYGDSPYQPFSAFAGNPLLIGLDELIEEGLLGEADVATHEPFREDWVNYGAAREFKDRALRRCYSSLSRRASRSVRQELAAFVEGNRFWLDDFALFMALKQRFNWSAWPDWDADIALRKERAVRYWHRQLRDEVDYQGYLQFEFARQWRRLKQYVNQAGISIIGDVPIFVGHDSADVWSHRELFYLDERGQPTLVAGVPPDYFSPTGQLWGNPLYRWEAMKRDAYAWWMERLRAVLGQVDVVRLDHFRGFGGYWEVPVDEETAINGRWVKGPGRSFFRQVAREFPQLPIIAEDLGVISTDVVALRRELGLPGMRVLQFAFGSDAGNPHLPHNYSRNCVVYTGTHDNDTTMGWFAAQDEQLRHRVRLYTGSDGSDINWSFIRLAMNSVCRMAIFPLQDVLGLGSEARLNQPGRPHGNWTWRYRPQMLTDELAAALRDMVVAAGRWLPPGEELEDSSPIELEYSEPGKPSTPKQLKAGGKPVGSGPKEPVGGGPGAR